MYFCSAGEKLKIKLLVGRVLIYNEKVVFLAQNGYNEAFVVLANNLQVNEVLFREHNFKLLGINLYVQRRFLFVIIFQFFVSVLLLNQIIQANIVL